VEARARASSRELASRLDQDGNPIDARTQAVTDERFFIWFEDE